MFCRFHFFFKEKGGRLQHFLWGNLGFCFRAPSAGALFFFCVCELKKDQLKKRLAVPLFASPPLACFFGRFLSIKRVLFSFAVVCDGGFLGKNGGKVAHMAPSPGLENHPAPCVLYFPAGAPRFFFFREFAEISSMKFRPH